MAQYGMVRANAAMRNAAGTIVICAHHDHAKYQQIGFASVEFVHVPPPFDQNRVETRFVASPGLVEVLGTHEATK